MHSRVETADGSLAVLATVDAHWPPLTMPKRVPEPTDDTSAYANAIIKFLDKGGNVDARHEHADRGLTMLMYASSKGLPDVVNLLVDRKASLDLQAGSNQYTALMYATRAGRHAVVSLLLRAGAATDIVDALGRTAMLQCRGPDTLALGDSIYYMCVPPTDDVNRCVDLLRGHMGLSALAPEERERRVDTPSVSILGGDTADCLGTAPSDGETASSAQPSAQGVASDLPSAQSPRVCSTCGSEGRLRCSMCKAARYCSKECQQAAWKEHRLDCTPAGR